MKGVTNLRTVLIDALLFTGRPLFAYVPRMSGFEKLRQGDCS